jgi:Lipocalin-like domain
MNRRHLLRISAITALGLAVLPSSAVSQQKSLKDQLVGTWTLTGWEQTRPDGSKLQRFGANPKGVQVFDANGRAYVLFSRPDLPKIASNNPSTPTPEEAKGIVNGSIGYYGTYTVDEGSKIITLKVEASTFPNQVGADQKRTVTSVSPDELKMVNTTVLSGGQISYAFKRAK